MNKIAVISGASYGLGEAISRNLLDFGYKVYGISRTKPASTHAQFVWIETDLSNDESLAAIAKQISEEKVDVLINNAGTAFLKKTLDYTDEDFERMYGMNFRIHVKLTQLLFPRLNEGLILNISSLADRYPDPKWGLYGSSKAALNLFFETMAAENPEVKILNILPSYVDTPLQHEVHDGTDFDWSTCMKSDDIADVVQNIIENVRNFETGSRVIVEKSPEENDSYIPERLWIYSVEKSEMKKVH